ncbi:Abi family protein [Staphylococcus epidermidis]|nr:Abi family protein [Staphylococcus epidermidis]MCG1638020.1 Abi family protein [Staphylococcus epidermidis]MCG1860886.1 Abi family protein [Staphylococcus epidermidis]MCG2361541.1 Abi family protein [Staphylococcus epidermidis]
MRPFKTIDEQIQILKDRGLIIEDHVETRSYLIRNNYYNVVNMYSKMFQSSENSYIAGTTFKEIKALHIFDTEFKNLFMKYIIIAEKHFKSIFAYYFAKRYHTKPYCYLDTSNYSDGSPLKLAKTLSYISNKIYHAKKDDNTNAIKHHYYAHNDVPIWVIVNDITLGDISNIYQLIDNRTRNDIAKEVCEILKTNTNDNTILEPSYLDKILKNILRVRNCVAHNNKLLHFNSGINLNYMPSLFDGLVQNRRSSRQMPFHTFLALQCLLPIEDYAIFHNSILKRANNMSKKLDADLTNKILLAYGFPENWHIETNKIPQP